MGIWKGQYEEISIDWDSPIKNPVNPRNICLENRGGLGWLDGFNEWIVRCGLSSLGEPGIDTIQDNQGNQKEIMLTLHGKIANIPASNVEIKIGLDPPFELIVEGIVYECTMFGSNLKLKTQITTIPDSNMINVTDIIENLSESTEEIQILYHCNYGSPFLENGTKMIAPIRKVTPRDNTTTKGINNFNVFGPPKSNFIEQVYYIEMLADKNGLTKVLLVNKDKTKATSISFSLNELPYFTLWKNTASINEGYVTGLEPATSFPNKKSFERKNNRIILLKPKEKLHTKICVSIYNKIDEIKKVVTEIERIKGKTKTVNI
jgi:hypothetical protein